MNQSATLAAFILAGFGLFIASRDRLSVYARILWGDKPGTHTAAKQVTQDDADGGTFPNWTLPGTIEDMTDSDFGKVLSDIYGGWDD